MPSTVIAAETFVSNSYRAYENNLTAQRKYYECRNPQIELRVKIAMPANRDSNVANLEVHWDRSVAKDE